MLFDCMIPFLPRIASANLYMAQCEAYREARSTRLLHIRSHRGYTDFSGTWLLTSLGKTLRNCSRIQQFSENALSGLAKKAPPASEITRRPLVFRAPSTANGLVVSCPLGRFYDFKKS